ncbi:DUF3551 domain-containing protein [Bradyrhizobium sp. UFLA05-109]
MAGTKQRFSGLGQPGFETAEEPSAGLALQGTGWGYPGNCQFSTYDKCRGSASSTDAYCGINPAYGYVHQQREWTPNHGGVRHF